jgi:hypothetical protein
MFLTRIILNIFVGLDLFVGWAEQWEFEETKMGEGGWEMGRANSQQKQRRQKYGGDLKKF